MNLEKFGVQELCDQEQKSIEGGWSIFRITFGGGGGSHGYLFGYRIW